MNGEPGPDDQPAAGTHEGQRMPQPHRTAVPKLNVHHQGRGRPLLCLHGVGHHWQAFTPVLGRLAAGGFEVMAADLPGFGESPPLPGADLSIPAYTDAVAAWIEAQGLEAPAVVGNSMGGAIALELARRGVARGVVAVSPAGFWTPRERRYCQASLRLTQGIPEPLRPVILRAVSTRAGRRLLVQQLCSRPERIPPEEVQAGIRSLWSSPAFAGALAAFDRYRFPDPARGEPLPAGSVTIAWGTRDFLLPYALQARRARRELPHVRHVTLPGLGHIPFWDDPGMVARVVLGVLG